MTEYLQVGHTGMIIREDTRMRWEKQQLARSLQEFPEPKKDRKRPRPNARKKRNLRAIGIERIIMDELAEPSVRRHFVNKKRAARSKKNLQERTERVVQERAVQMVARAKDWFRLGRGR